MSKLGKARLLLRATVLTAVMLSTAAVPAFGAGLPSRLPLPPAPVPVPVPVMQAETSPTWAYIVLHVKYDDLVARRAVEEQTLWTGVQWQDGFGAWHAVEGWQSGFDGVGGGVGTKAWWVAGGDHGSGPFRWVVFAQDGGNALATSEQFFLPRAAGQTVEVNLSLTPGL